MKWTSELPKEDGWYWYKEKHLAPFIYYVEVVERKGKRYIYLDDEPLDKGQDMKWAGPIPEPE